MSTPGSEPRPDNHVIVLFGATGDLAKRKQYEPGTWGPPSVHRLIAPYRWFLR